ncbi:spore maturation protein [Heyndrickxia sporothermodurans]|uniref:Spore maturation protein n=1 Tax=Heyndrickxia sporothermodurans TaxID=46224 RepID=A0AB37H924_9BACI|nr:spore maturation protein [Heyndrickxia sporothermodurans]MBL5768313.1 spore maturation protein [Heyndrickxia sporothermodurans]MBL5771939.1 spore maturation protein [Heyndrickxia sporothermodurans]MBL5775547.1 spore maturation protein [Heyndrickxia sporothermodurans]MBL5779270.1 spore maturation protein [Heyndrickxia sporothermodurans]MBL5782645.1 spore maturation protein [Heyndrickxia sporothermodurans]
MYILSIVSIWIIPILIGFILIYSVMKKTPAYESFVDGGKEGIKIAVSIIPFLVGMLVAITVFRASGALDFFVQLLRPVLDFLGVPSEIVPLALIRPISGNAALGIMSDILKVHGPDTFIGKLASTIQGSTDTTLYVLTVYFGAVGIKKMGDALKVGLLADLVGIGAAIIIITWMFG